MRKLTIILAGLGLMGSSLACCIMPQIPDIELPDIDINVPTVEVGELREVEEEIPLSGAESAAVNVRFGAGELDIEAGEPDSLLAGRFRYNVEQWKPSVTYEEGELKIEQGGTKEDWGIPTGNTRNEWELAFSPQIPLEMKIDIGAGEGDLDFSGLKLSELDLRMGAGDSEVKFTEPNPIGMDDLTLETGAAKLDVRGIGYASPEKATVNGGVGEITLDFSGEWSNSSEVDIMAGVGAITLRLPDDIGVRVETVGGLTNIEAAEFRRTDGAYVNDVFGETEIELRIHVTTGVGNLRLVSVSND
jgi:hypothetical protein